MAQTFPQLNRHTQEAKKIRAALLAKLGGKCVLCQKDDPDKLEFDHINGRNYEPRKLSYKMRMIRYRREAAKGELRLLCGDCNRRERKTNDNGQYVPTAVFVNGEVLRTGHIPF